MLQWSGANDVSGNPDRKSTTKIYKVEGSGREGNLSRCWEVRKEATQAVKATGVQVK